MRNLKKILALVLALAMSLSLMATASAADTTAASDASKYQTAIDVLQGVGVVKGDAGTNDVRPTASITRAEVAALLYRIATGDVNDAQKDIHTGQGFTDVNAIDWYAGYVSYCYIAEIIKGNPNGTFEPNKEINGYATLAMILRAMGYGKNGEFVGDGWEIRTASTAKQIGILDGIVDTQLSGPTTRELVFEILFRAILKDMVKFDAREPYVYPSTGETLAKKNLGLEEVVGVVTANEYADLYGAAPLAEGKTKLDNYVINTTTGFDDIGESKLAYIQNGKTVIKIADSGKNAKAESLAEEKNLNRILGEAGIETDADTERFVNFGQGTNWTSDWKIKYVIKLDWAARPIAADADQFDNIAYRIYNVREIKGYPVSLPEFTVGSGSPYEMQRDKDGNCTGVTYTAEFAIQKDITAPHQTNITTIFNVADHSEAADGTYYAGQVYVGTTSVKDISDDKSLEQFKADYIEETDEAVVSNNQRGNWLKVIDNDADGKADYILKVIYTVAQVTNVKDDVITLDVKNRTLVNLENNNRYNVCEKDSLNTLTSEPVTTKDDADYTEPAAGDVVYYAIIDGNAYAYKADMEVATFDDVNRNTRVAKTVDGTEWTESQVCEHIEDEAYMSNITAIAGKVSYDVYFDRGGYVAAFAKTEVSDFKLITDGWFNSTKNNGYEYAVKVYNDETEEQDIVDIATNGSLFISGAVQNPGDWSVRNNDWNALKYLGGASGINATQNMMNHNKGNANTSAEVAATLNGGSRTCNVDATGKETHTSPTNIVKTTVAAVSGDTILPVENASVSGRYQRNIIDMGTTIPNSTYKTGTAYTTSTNSNTAYDSVTEATFDDKGNFVSSDVEVRALGSTVYYVVYPTNSDYETYGATSVGVKSFKGYSTSFSALADRIEDVYVVGTRHVADNDLGNDANKDNIKTYYTANIVVIELNKPYPGTKNIVFVVDDESSGVNVSKRPVRVIKADGTEATVTVVNQPNRYGKTLDASTEDWGSATPKFRPGLYWLNSTSVKDEYILTALEPMEIRENGFTLGYVQYQDVTGDDDYVTVIPVMLDNGRLVPNTAEKGTPYKANKDAAWSLGYGVEGYTRLSFDKYCRDAAEASTGTVSEVLDGRKDIVEYGKWYDLDRDTWTNWNVDVDHQTLRSGYNYNRVLVSHNSKNEMSYAISFDNLVKGTDNTLDFAQQIWSEIARAWLDASVTYNTVKVQYVDANNNVMGSENMKITDGGLKLSDTKIGTFGSMTRVAETPTIKDADGKTVGKIVREDSTIGGTTFKGFTLSDLKTGYVVTIKYEQKAGELELDKDGNIEIEEGIVQLAVKNGKNEDATPKLIYKNFELQEDGQKATLKAVNDGKLDAGETARLYFDVLGGYKIGEITVDGKAVAAVKAADADLPTGYTGDYTKWYVTFTMPAAAEAGKDANTVAITVGPSAKVPTTGATEEVKPTVETTADGSVAAEPKAEDIIVAVNNAGADGTVNIDATTETGAATGKTETTLTAAVVTALTGGESGEETAPKNVTVKTDIGDVTIPTTTLAEKAVDDDGTTPIDVVLVVEPVKDADLVIADQTTKEAIVAPIDVKLQQTDGTEVPVEGLSEANAITVTFPVAPELVGKNPAVYYVNDSGELSQEGIVKTAYSLDGKQVTISITHLTVFVQVSSDKIQDAVGEEYTLYIQSATAKIAEVKANAKAGEPTVVFKVTKAALGEDWMLGTQENGQPVVAATTDGWTVTCQTANNTTKTYTVKATTLVPSVVVGRADIGTHGTSDALDALQTVTVSGTNVTVKTGTDGMKLHKNGQDKYGAWVGFEVALAAADTANNEPTWAKVTYTWSGTNGTNTALEEGLVGGTNKGVAFYYDAAKAAATDTVKVQFSTEDGSVKSKELTYTVDLSGAKVMDHTLKTYGEYTEAWWAARGVTLTVANGQITCEIDEAALNAAAKKEPNLFKAEENPIVHMVGEAAYLCIPLSVKLIDGADGAAWKPAEGAMTGFDDKYENGTVMAQYTYVAKLDGTGETASWKVIGSDMGAGNGKTWTMTLVFTTGWQSSENAGTALTEATAPTAQWTFTSTKKAAAPAPASEVAE